MGRLPALLLLVPLLALAACGGDDGDGSSRDDYIAAADAICERLNEDIAEANESRPSNLAELRALLDRGLEVTREGFDEFEQLDPPEELEDEVDDFLDSAREQAEVLEEARDADTIVAASQILRERLPEIEEARRDAAEEIGFEECGRGRG